MNLYLIRHGETVDNVAGLYAGTRDSALTNHGVEQTERLGQYFARNNVKFTHVFSSPLSRASKTAKAIADTQPRSAASGEDSTAKKIEIVKVEELIERDFGYYEGRPFSSRAEPKVLEGEAHNEKHKSIPGFVDVESKESMATRIDDFLERYLLPLFDEDGKQGELVVAIVSHGMLLSNFWKRLLLRLPRKSLTIAPEVTGGRDNIILEHVGGWSNSGYLELSIRKDREPEEPESKPNSATEASALPSDAGEEATLPTPVPQPLQSEDAEVSIAPTQSDEPGLKSGTAPRTLAGWSTTILAIDSKTHLLGLKRQRGGIGSLAYDEGQRKLDSFFKRPKLT